MTGLIAPTQSFPLRLRLPPAVVMTDEQFFDFCQLNRDLRIERNAAGELVIMPPTGSETGERNFNLTGQLWLWTEQEGSGIGCDSSTGFTLPNGARRSPNAAWIKRKRWNQLTPEQQKKFAPISPDFVVELRSESDSLTELQAKMQEYIENGVKLGWLIDRQQQRVYIYQSDRDVECLENPASVSSNLILPRLVLNLSKIW